MNLQQAGYHPAILPGPPIDFLQQFQAVDPMNQRNVRNNILHLVPLKVPDHMPANIPGEGFPFPVHFLNLVLAKIHLARLICLHNFCRGFGLGYGYQGNMAGEGHFYGTEVFLY